MATAEEPPVYLPEAALKEGQFTVPQVTWTASPCALKAGPLRFFFLTWSVIDVFLNESCCCEWEFCELQPNRFGDLASKEPGSNLLTVPTVTQSKLCRLGAL
jgi:hypothetical protein